MKFPLVITLLLLTLTVNSQSELNFYINDQHTSFPKNSLAWIDSTEDKSIANFYKNKNQFTSSIPITLSNLNGQIWILLPLDNDVSQNINYLVITNPHINHIRSWWLDQNYSVVKEQQTTGDHHAFQTREVIGLNYVFARPTETCNYVLILIDKRKEILTANIHLANMTFLEKRLTQETILFGWLIGIVAVICIVSIVLLIYIKEKVYLTYFLFLIFMLIYSVSDFGFANWLLAYSTDKNIDFIRPISLILGMVFYISFIEQILETKNHFKILRKALRIILFIFIGMFLVFSSLYFLTTNKEIHVYIAYYGVIISHNFQRLLIAILVLIVIQSTRKNLKYSILIAFSVFLFLGVHFVNHFYEVGVLPDKLIFQHFLPLIYTVDCLIMSIIIARKFLNYHKQSLQLTQELLVQKIEYNSKLNEVKEKDLTRISQYLHDNIGAEISSMRYDLEALKSNPNPALALERIIAKSSHIANEVRNASHNLSPLMLERFGLEESIGQFLTQINKSSSCNFQLDVIGDIETIDKNLKIILFQIIQEGIQNILKHAQAKNAILQIMCETANIQLFIEDDGVGCNPQTIRHGLGLDSIKQLLEYKKGVFQFKSEPNKGAKIYVELPL
jgi:signal transduction histidine kinase